MRKQPSQDKTLYDHIKELWTAWVLDEDPLLSQVANFDNFLLGYFTYYYKGDTRPTEAALTFFMKEVELWEAENDPSSEEIEF